MTSESEPIQEVIARALHPEPTRAYLSPVETQRLAHALTAALAEVERLRRVENAARAAANVTSWFSEDVSIPLMAWQPVYDALAALDGAEGVG